MVPSPRGTRPPRPSAPLARGDGPVSTAVAGCLPVCSPRTRGWSTMWRRGSGWWWVLPSHAGMVPKARTAFTWRLSAPRARGDGPRAKRTRLRATLCSPRTRGWSLSTGHPPFLVRVLPAHAGMVPGRDGAGAHDSRAPRARGDGPEAHHQHLIDRKCSPRTRGWSRQGPEGLRPVGVLPAHAGMVPSSAPRSRARPSASRARGDGPRPPPADFFSSMCFPRTRGWSPRVQQRSRGRRVLPAHAGMVPRSSNRRGMGFRAPRARGDGPLRAEGQSEENQCSPRTRGWSLVLLQRDASS